MIQPVRAQRSRAKGFKMIHPNGLPNYYAGRPGKFGNPFKLIGDCIYVDASNRRVVLADEWVFVTVGSPQMLQDVYRATLTDSIIELSFVPQNESVMDIKYWVRHFQGVDVYELKGKNLYCYCGLADKCHADVLLDLANQ